MPHIVNLFNLFLDTVRRLEPAMLLVVRLGVAYIFMSSGLTKINDFESAKLLFEYEYNVPLISPVFAAYSATFFELVCPALLIVGLASRAATLPLLAMTAVIQFTYLEHLQHAWWAIMLGVVLFVGPGKLSLDHLVARKVQSNHAT